MPLLPVCLFHSPNQLVRGVRLQRFGSQKQNRTACTSARLHQQKRGEATLEGDAQEGPHTFCNAAIWQALLLQHTSDGDIAHIVDLTQARNMMNRWTETPSFFRASRNLCTVSR